MNKLGSYITKLMTTVLDKEQEQFVRDLALSEIKKKSIINIGVMRSPPPPRPSCHIRNCFGFAQPHPDFPILP